MIDVDPKYDYESYMAGYSDSDSNSCNEMFEDGRALGHEEGYNDCLEDHYDSQPTMTTEEKVVLVTILIGAVIGGINGVVHLSSSIKSKIDEKRQKKLEANSLS